jgi:hypothetical protein
VGFDAVHSILLRPCFPFREQQKMMPPFWEKKKSANFHNCRCIQTSQYALDICFKKGSGKLTLHYERGTNSSNSLPEFFVGGERRREAIGLGVNSKTATETNWKCARSDDELKPELQITTHHSMQQDTKLHTEFHVAERFEAFFKCEKEVNQQRRNLYWTRSQVFSLCPHPLGIYPTKNIIICPKCRQKIIHNLNHDILSHFQNQQETLS